MAWLLLAAVYNYAFSLFGAALNVFFPLYVAGFLLGLGTLAGTIARFDPTAIAGASVDATSVRLVAAYLVFVAAGLSVIWIGLWGAYASRSRGARGGVSHGHRHRGPVACASLVAPVRLRDVVPVGRRSTGA